MIRIDIINQLTMESFEAASGLWNLTGVGNPARGDSFEAVNQTLIHGARLILVYDNDIPVGTVWLTHDFRRLYIHHMAVHPEWQNQGIGKLLMQEALKIAKELNLQSKLEVHETNLPANKLYTQFGFQVLDGYKTMIKRNT